MGLDTIFQQETELLRGMPLSPVSTGTRASDMFIIRAEQEVVSHVGHVFKYDRLGLTPKPKT